jgi:hypothetical protein
MNKTNIILAYSNFKLTRNPEKMRANEIVICAPLYNRRVAQVVSKFCASYVARLFIAVFTKAHY